MRDREELFAKNGFPVARCRACRLVYVDAELTAGDLQEAYGPAYYEGDVFANYIAERDVRLASAHASCEILKALEPRGRLLDVGCAAGFFLAAAAQTYDATGVELSAYAADYARQEFGLRVLTGDLCDVDLDGEQFDVVTMWNTVEHLADPLGVVRTGAGLMRPGGLLVLTTGDVAGPLARRDLKGWNLMQPPEHLFYFSPRTIALLAQLAGFEVRRIVHDGIVDEGLSLRVPALRPLFSAVGLGNVMTVYARRAIGRREPSRRSLWGARFRPLRLV